MKIVGLYLNESGEIFCRPVCIIEILWEATCRMQQCWLDAGVHHRKGKRPDVSMMHETKLEPLQRLVGNRWL